MGYRAAHAGPEQGPRGEGKFVERKYLAMLTAPLDFSGTLVYTAPGRLEKNTLAPKPERLVLDQDKLTLNIRTAASAGFSRCRIIRSCGLSSRVSVRSRGCPRH